jgi:hypothetical protein
LAADPAFGGVTVAAAAPSQSPFFRIDSIADSAADESGTLVFGRPSVAVNQVDGEYFHTFEQRLIAGRLFDATDLEPERRTIVINRSLAEMVFGAQNPLGRRVRFFVEERPNRGGKSLEWLATAPRTALRRMSSTVRCLSAIPRHGSPPLREHPNRCTWSLEHKRAEPAKLPLACAPLRRILTPRCA